MLNEGYAIQIARDWSAKDPSTGYRGHVRRFQVRAACPAQYDRKTFGGRLHQEYWISAEDLEEQNQNIVELIDVVHEFHGCSSWQRASGPHGPASTQRAQVTE
jgi:hypothetical protein